MARLTVSIVTFAPDLGHLDATLESLGAALVRAFGGSCGPRETRLVLVDNGPGPEAARQVRERADGFAARYGVPVECLSGQGNVGFGGGHNLALARSRGPYHLVLNPDVVMEPDALAQAMAFLEAHAGVGLLAPAVIGPDGAPGHLCKRYPDALTLALRGFAPAVLRRLFAERLRAYEMADLATDRVTTGIPLASGSFMFCRREVLERAGGFDPGFFLYFEDFDLSLRVGRLADIAFVPTVRIRHFGGGAARKGWRSVRLFTASAWWFFRKHGWRPPTKG